jgi:hypothetical protein
VIWAEVLHYISLPGVRSLWATTLTALSRVWQSALGVIIFVVDVLQAKGEKMKNLRITALAVLIAVAFIAQPVAVSVAQRGGGAIAGAMIGNRLFNLLGEDLGRIDCITFDDDGQPAFIILAVMGAKIIPIPFSALLPSSGRDRFVVNISRNQLRRTPSYSINARNAC